MRRLLIALGLLAATISPAHAQTSGCEFLTGGGPAAFCDTFDQPAGIGDRAGGLNGTVWGVSRWTGSENPGQGSFASWPDTMLNKCGTLVAVTPPNDVDICNGHVVESINDNTSTATISMYPRQPFDIAGREGTVVFDVSDDTNGNHSAWPAFNFTDQPVPAPHAPIAFYTGINTPRNAVYVGLGSPTRNANGLCNQVDDFNITSNYTTTHYDMTIDGCAQQPALDSQVMNHVEIKISESGVKVYMGDAGNPSSTHLIAHWNGTVPLTRGLVWMQDVHYNAEKASGPGSPNEQVHTFAWDNFGFDGPVLPRDLGYTVADNNQLYSAFGNAQDGQPIHNIYYNLAPSVTLNWTLPVAGVENAAGALLETSFYSVDQTVLTYSLNGGPAHTFVYPGWATAAHGGFTVEPYAMPVDLSEVHDGINSVTFSSNNGGNLGNVDLILLGAGGGGTVVTPTPVPATPTPTSTPTPAPTATPVVTPTPLSLTCSSGNALESVKNGSLEVTCQ